MIKVSDKRAVKKRDGREVPFDGNRIFNAMAGAFRAEIGLKPKDTLNTDIETELLKITEEVVDELLDQANVNTGVPVESIQDFVEIQLMRHGHYRVARRYIVYREEHKKVRVLRGDATDDESKSFQLRVQLPTGELTSFDPKQIRSRLFEACLGLEDRCSSYELEAEIFSSLFDGITPLQIHKAMILAARSRIEKEPAYGTVAARLLLRSIYKEVLGKAPCLEELEPVHTAQFKKYLHAGVEAKRLAPDLLEYDLKKIASAIRPERDRKFTYMGLQTLFDRYLIHLEGTRIETPQYFWMRVAMGLALREGDQKNERAIEFYNILSTFRFVSSTPTLFNAGTRHPQLSSCYLSTTTDDLEHIFKVVQDNAKLSKWAGGLGNDWTNIRATGSYISGTNGQSQGVIPFLKVVNDTAVAVNQGGKRKGAVCAYLETWHLDVEDFLDLRKNTGDERRRTHDMHTANWIPDLFMKRVEAGGKWSLFSPNETSDLHDLYGQAFEKRYEEYEEAARKGQLRKYKEVDAVDLWRKMLSMLFETGHPWITFKDPSNIRSPQDHAGVVHSSNLCTEILLNTNEHETAVCNLGSINLAIHTDSDGLDKSLMEGTVRTAIRMLDNVIDINFYPTPEARNANQRHRPVGLGLMGFQDALYKQRIPYSSQAAVEFSDVSMEMISYYAILASSSLAKERGRYASYPGSKWDRGLLPIDTIDLLEKERGGNVDVDRSSRLDWDRVRKAVAKHGVRNSNTMAIAPTATIANISGVYQSIEPAYRHLFVKSNLSGEFTIVNPYLVADLKERDLWNEEMIDDLKYFDGEIRGIEKIPDDLKELYQTAFEIEPKWLIECASRRQKWIDMGQSLNLYLSKPLGKVLNDMYFTAWRKGLKTTYYLRSLGATQVEKSNMDINRRGIQPRWMKNQSSSSQVKVNRVGSAAPKACSIDDPDCEACQ